MSGGVDSRVGVFVPNGYGLDAILLIYVCLKKVFFFVVLGRQQCRAHCSSRLCGV